MNVIPGHRLPKPVLASWGHRYTVKNQKNSLNKVNLVNYIYMI